ncbi:hypothetical protein A2Z33_05575 [Candidatus Gottesmanbacteria bacterium RBG_16_52_11]|uniref:DegT/DnrJ/EryC1/StrS aminotransferase n=1 Tax=Candidatus Gottesmanbacteria bacterium RBG_16_52_11 TaxID=1798374 RepID=A0A1F5YNA8_9BACT|nr:MAG: hypothetical protein A2Z33_05575 [Candidatus Gottesmanbacteria bacterium RBG_16_52_11]
MMIMTPQVQFFRRSRYTYSIRMIKLIKSTFYKESATKKKLINFIQQARQLSFGPECEQFEKRFAAWQGRRHCVMLNSGSSANLAVIQALINLGYLRRGDRVGFSAVTWSTNVMPLFQLGLEPVAVDVSLETLNVTSANLEDVLKRTDLKMLFLTNLLGFCSDIDTIAAICRKRNIILIEDTCESQGSVYRGKRLGNFGLAGTFSFYVGHHMSTVEGGAVATDNEKLATMLRLVRAHGWDRNLSFAKQEEIRRRFRVNSTFYSRYTFYDLGYNLRPTEITGYLGQLQLELIDEIVSRRQRNFLELAERIYARTDRYYPLSFGHMDTVSNFAIPIIARTGLIRDELVKICEGKVEIRPVVGGDMTEQPFFRHYAPGTQTVCPNAGLIHSNGLYFGNNPELTHTELALLSSIFGGSHPRRKKAAIPVRKVRKISPKK